MEETSQSTTSLPQEAELNPMNDDFVFEHPVQGIFCDEDVSTFLNSSVCCFIYYPFLCLVSSLTSLNLLLNRLIHPSDSSYKPCANLLSEKT